MYEIVIEEAHARRGGNRYPFANRPTVVGTAITRELALDMASGLLVMTRKLGFVGHPFEWDRLSVWDTATDQVVKIYSLKDEGEELDKWIGRTQWLKAGAVQHGHCST